MGQEQFEALGPIGAPAAVQTATLFAAAVQHHRASQLTEAEQLYRQVLALDPGHADSLHRLGLIAYQVGRPDVAVDLLNRAIAIDRTVAAYHSHLSLALEDLGRLEEAAVAGGAAVALAPEAADGHGNLGLVLLKLGRAEEAADCCRRAIALAPDLADGHNILGAALHELGRIEEAADCYRQAIRLAPDLAQAHTNLGNALLDLGSPQGALEHHRLAVQLAPRLPEGHNNLAQTLQRLGRPDEAERSLRQALGLTPGRPEILVNLAQALLALGRPAEAAEAAMRGLAVSETPAGRSAFVRCMRQLRLEAGGEALRPWLVRALRGAWSQAEFLTRVSLDLIVQAPPMAAMLERARAAWPGPATSAELYGEDGLAAVAGDDLLLEALVRAPNVDFGLERLLTLARGVLLRTAKDGAELPGSAVTYYAALARQCFINEYVFRLDPDEAALAAALGDRLGDTLKAGRAPPIALVLAVGCYRPLASIPMAERLAEHDWPAPVAAVLTQQVAEPGEEDRLRATMPRLTPIGQSSLRVQAQYEQNPYPRWIDPGAPEAPTSLGEHLVRAFPMGGLQPLSARDGVDILIAGCGTGRNAIDTARSFKGARTLAVDLSLSSLAYAQRKSREAGLIGIEYAQADLLEIGGPGRDFDLIEAMGVLHHLADPMAGWRALLEVLRPGGVMRVGLYSALARRNLPRIEIVEPTPDAVRQARQTLAAEGGQALEAQDFYSLSGCRDLLFHEREHRLDLGQIDAFLQSAGLRFIGFALDASVLTAFRQRFPNDRGAVDLANWQAFEQDHPDTFTEMYQFWVQKP